MPASPETTSPFDLRAAALIASPGRFAVLATIDPDGAPHQALVWYRLVDGAIVVNSRVGRRWPRNLARDPRVAVTIASDRDWVGIVGTVEPRGDQAVAQADIAAMAHAYESPEEAAASIARFRTEERISFRVVPERVHVEIEETPG